VVKYLVYRCKYSRRDEIVTHGSPFWPNLGMVRFLDAPDKDYPKTSCRNEIAVGDNGLASSSPPPELKLLEIDQATKPTITCVEPLSGHVEVFVCHAKVQQLHK
jgi:hypothetical protein